MRSRVVAHLACIFAGLALFARPAPARADGAFPASDKVLLPADRPMQIVLSTNFGLIISDDGGTSWQWTCERPQTSMAVGYAVGPPPADRMYALSDVGLAISDDGSCSWHLAGGALAAMLPSDYFPDPTDATHVLAIARPMSDAGVAGDAAVYESADGGDTFAATPLYVAPAGDLLVGVEIARADPQVIYLALAAPGPHPLIARSDDGGAHWTTFDAEPALGAATATIVAVDPADANVVYLRELGGGGDRLAVSRDGGMTFTTPITVMGGSLSAFARLASGTVLVAGLVPGDGGTSAGVGWRSVDGGVTFQDWTLTPAPRLHALAERGGVLYLAGENYQENGWALAVSTDEGQTLQPIARYDQVSAVKACVAAACQDSCDEQAGRHIWAPEVCNPTPADAGADAGHAPKPSSGCGCEAAGAPGGREIAVLCALAFTVLGSAARRRRRGRSCS